MTCNQGYLTYCLGSVRRVLNATPFQSTMPRRQFLVMGVRYAPAAIKKFFVQQKVLTSGVRELRNGENANADGDLRFWAENGPPLFSISSDKSSLASEYTYPGTPSSSHVATLTLLPQACTAGRRTPSRLPIPAKLCGVSQSDPLRLCGIVPESPGLHGVAPRAVQVPGMPPPLPPPLCF